MLQHTLHSYRKIQKLKNEHSGAFWAILLSLNLYKIGMKKLNLSENHTCQDVPSSFLLLPFFFAHVGQLNHNMYVISFWFHLHVSHREPKLLPALLPWTVLIELTYIKLVLVLFLLFLISSSNYISWHSPLRNSPFKADVNVIIIWVRILRRKASERLNI